MGGKINKKNALLFFALLNSAIFLSACSKSNPDSQSTSSLESGENKYTFGGLKPKPTDSSDSHASGQSGNQPTIDQPYMDQLEQDVSDAIDPNAICDEDLLMELYQEVANAQSALQTLLTGDPHNATMLEWMNILQALPEKIKNKVKLCGFSMPTGPGSAQGGSHGSSGGSGAGGANNANTCNTILSQYLISLSGSPNIPLSCNNVCLAVCSADCNVAFSAQGVSQCAGLYNVRTEIRDCFKTFMTSANCL